MTHLCGRASHMKLGILEIIPDPTTPIKRKSTEFTGSSTLHDRIAFRNHGRDGMIPADIQRRYGESRIRVKNRGIASANRTGGVTRVTRPRNAVRSAYWKLITRSFSGSCLRCTFSALIIDCSQMRESRRRIRGRKEGSVRRGGKLPRRKVFGAWREGQGGSGDLIRASLARAGGFSIEINGGSIVTHLTSRSLYKRRSYRYEWGCCWNI